MSIQAVLYLDGRILAKQNGLRQEVFALANYSARRKDLKLVIYHASALTENFYGILSKLGSVKLVAGDEKGTVPMQGQSLAKHVFLVTSETDPHPQGKDAFLIGTPLDLWAARLFALADSPIDGIHKDGSVFHVVGENLRSLLADFRSQFVIRFSA